MIPITKYGFPQVVVYPLITIVLMIIIFCLKKYMPQPVMWTLFSIAAIIFIWELSFFRDPPRKVPTGNDFLISPADGKITVAEVVDDERFEGGKAFRISIFLSVFNVHVNRMPAKCVVENITYKPGKFINALDADCAKVNEANEVTVRMLNEPGYKLIIRQVSGAIARRIVCDAMEGDEFECGQKFGMIKFGSCTEIYMPAGDNFKCLVKPGDKVRAGLNKLIEFDLEG
ncbi:MAG: phosphatidylserine decarboxylase [Sedimentisphaeraceae bacterium JB056]